MYEQIEKGTIPMTVTSQVVKYFSIGLYQNFARAIKELISNSYDAGALDVKIRLDLISGRIVIRDNGRGMDKKDLEEKFLKIGFPTPLTEDVDELDRKRIGTFGIGAVAIFPYCNKVTILTKKRNTDKKIELYIDTSKFFKDGSFLLQEGEEQAKFPYVITKSDIPYEEGQTIIILEDVKPHILFDLREKEIAKPASLDKFSGYEKFKWTLGQYCPLLFAPEHEKLNDFFCIPNRVPLHLWLDGNEIFRNVPEGAKILETGEKQFGNIKVKFVIMSPLGTVRPEEAKGLQIRLRDVGIGLPKDFEIIKLTGKVPGKLNWLCGEVHITEGLGNSLMIDRDSFSYTNEVARLDDFFRKKLAEWDGRLQKLAEQDKTLYEVVQNLKGSSVIIEELKEAEILKVPKSRLRIPKKPISKSKRRRRKSASPVTKIQNVLSEEKELQVESRKLDSAVSKPPIEISADKKKLVIYEDHPAFAETIQIFNKTFDVDYSKWDFNETPSICKLDKSKKKVIFNLSNPLFNSGLADNVVKELSLGLFLILKEEPNGMRLLEKIEQLLLDIIIKRD